MSPASRKECRVKKLVGRLINDQSGQTAVEYALVIAFVVIGLVLGAYAMVPTISDGMDQLAKKIKKWLGG